MEKSNALKSEAFLTTLMENASLGIVFVDESGHIIKLNRLSKDLLDIRPLNKDFIGDNFMDLIQHIPLFQEKLSKFLEKSRKSFTTEVIKLSEKYIVIKGVSLEKGYICIINDLTRLKIMEVESIQSIIAGQENERRRIAREIHDGIGPLLAYSKLELDAFLDDYIQQNNSFAEDKLLNISQTLDSISNDLRDLSHHLIPRLLEEFGLISAFSNLTTKLNNTIKAEVRFYSNIEAEIRFDQDLELTLFRCAQELLNNVVKHAKASLILVQVINHEHSIVLMVDDDGVGIQKKEQDPMSLGIGLTNIETRVRTLNGVFLVESSEKGTMASIELPIKKM